MVFALWQRENVLRGACVNAACRGSSHIAAECHNPTCPLDGPHMAVEKGCMSCREFMGTKGSTPCAHSTT